MKMRSNVDPGGALLYAHCFRVPLTVIFIAVLFLRSGQFRPRVQAGIMPGPILLKRRFSMRLKGQLTRMLMVGGLAVMTAGLSQAGGGCWCGNPTPRAMTQPMAAQPSAFSAFWSVLLALI